MRLWLALAGIFDPDVTRGSRLYAVSRERLEEILGIGLDTIDRLSHLTNEQRSFLRALVRVADKPPLVANNVADLATCLYGTAFNHKALPQTVLFPLESEGFIELKKTTPGRGAKPYEIAPTNKFLREISDPILTAAAEKAKIVPRELFEVPLSHILSDLAVADTYVKGKALEVLAIYFARLLDLQFKGWRIRSSHTGGAEVDAIVEGARLIFSRWQIQAKNTATVRLDDVAKEVGLSLTFIYSNVVMVITTGDFTSDAYDYARHVMQNSNLNIILIHGSDLNRIADSPTSIASLLNEKARNAMKINERSDYFSS